MVKLLFNLILVLFLTNSHSLVLAQDDPNAQYVILQSGIMSSEPVEMNVPVEAGVLRLQFTVQFSGKIRMEIFNPLEMPLVLTEPNVVITENNEKQTVLIWDPKPGNWKVRLSGTGSYTVNASVQGEIYICCMQFFDGKGVFSLDRFQPGRGVQHHAQVYASAYSVDRLEFNLVDENGRQIKPLRFRQSDYSNPYSYTIVLDVPDQPFRIQAKGWDQNNRRFQRVLRSLIIPRESEPQEAVTENSPRVNYNNQSLINIGKSALAGEQKVIRAEVLNWEDQQLLSDSGNPIGIRLTYTVRFPEDGLYSPPANLYPEQIGHGYTGALTMRIQKGEVNPLPEGMQNPDQLVFNGRADYKAGVDYRFSLDLVPVYLNFNYQDKSFCLQIRQFSQPGIRERFEREIESARKLRYRITISGTNLDGRQPTVTNLSYQPSEWHKSFVKEQIPQCK